MGQLARREKRTRPVTVHLRPSLFDAIEQLSSHEQRTLSTYVARALERDPTVQTVLRQIGPAGANSS